jgi:hypothetical protein
MMHRVRTVLLLVLVAAPLAGAAQQRDAAASAPEAAALSEGWSLLARGDAAGAARAAARAMAANPSSVAAVALAIDAELARDSSAAALAAYEKWMGPRRLDDAYALRRVSAGLLREATRKDVEILARQAALEALAADGDREAIAMLEEAMQAGSFADVRTLAATGNESAVRRLIAQLRAAYGHKGAIIAALAESGSPLAVAPLRELLKDTNEGNRAAAADALGTLGATDAIPDLRALLNDPVYPVKLKAAGALYRLNDNSGLPFLIEVTQSEHAAVRVTGVKELSSRPDTLWQALVRGLASDPDPMVRLEAARLIAPYDQPLAKRVLDELARHANIAIREAASAVLVDHAAADLATLRGLLASPNLRVRVKAAGRLLELTR